VVFDIFKETIMKTFRNQKRVVYQFVLLFFATTFLLSMFFTGAVIKADAIDGENHGKPLEVVLQEIREKQGLSPNEPINPRKVSNEDLEELGEAVMSVMFPDPRQHEIMDNMMGGEGSRQLARMHRRMGYNYLSGGSYGMMGGMM
jgi:hypothetical protein